MTKRRIQLSSRFERDIKHLKRKYPHLQDDLSPIVSQLQVGETPGDQVPDLEAAVYKVHVPSRDQQKGKQGGFRLLYYLWTAQRVVLLSLYAKSERSQLTNAQIRQIIAELGTLPPDDESI